MYIIGHTEGRRNGGKGHSQFLKAHKSHEGTIDVWSNRHNNKLLMESFSVRQLPSFGGVGGGPSYEISLHIIPKKAEKMAKNAPFQCPCKPFIIK